MPEYTIELIAVGCGDLLALRIMTLHEKHMHRVELVNRSTTEAEHRIRYWELSAWRSGIEDAGIRFDLCAADYYYLDRGIDRPMCCGVWLDWSEANVQGDGSPDTNTQPTR